MTNTVVITTVNKKAQKRQQAWQSLRSMLELGQTATLHFRPSKNEGWLMARFKSIPCYLLKSEVVTVPESDSIELTVKVVSTSRKSRSALVSSRLLDSTEQLQQEAVKRQAIAAKRKAGLMKQAQSEKAALAEFDRLKVGETVSGTVLRSIKLQPRRGKRQLLYFVKIGEHLVGGIREQELPYVGGDKTRRVLTKGELIDVRVQRKHSKVNAKTNKATPKVDLTLPVPLTSAQFVFTTSTGFRPG